MRITKIQAKNFRILQNSVMDFERDLCLLLGRNNTGKTSFMVLIEKFLRNVDFSFNDFSINLRSQLFAFDEKTDVTELAIQLIMTLEYDEKDNLVCLGTMISGLKELLLLKWGIIVLVHILGIGLPLLIRKK